MTNQIKKTLTAFSSEDPINYDTDCLKLPTTPNQRYEMGVAIYDKFKEENFSGLCVTDTLAWFVACTIGERVTVEQFMKSFEKLVQERVGILNKKS